MESSEELALEDTLDSLNEVVLIPIPVNTASGPGRAHKPKRSDIQCLRALAVSLVFLFHLDLPYVPGGFIGVDIFFVISGYLVGGRIIRDKIASSFSFLEFIGRRLQRLFLPSVLCLVFALICLAALRLPIGWDMSFATIYGANIYFFVDQTSYFKADLTTSFVLHFWSLAVEEQIYVFLPLVLYLYWRTHTLLSTSIFVLPLTLASFLTIFFVPEAAKFYLPSSRLWEFLLGTIVAMYEEPLCEQLKSIEALQSKYTVYALEAFKWICITSLVICAVFYSSNDWPNAFAIFPVVGTAVIILIDTPIACAPIEHIGDYSYAIYLFHWPIIRVFSIVWMDMAHTPFFVYYFIILFLTGALAVACFYIVEHPTFRYLNCRPIRWFSFAAAITIVLLGVTLFPSFLGASRNDPIRPPADYANITYDLDCFIAGAHKVTPESIRSAARACVSAVPADIKPGYSFPRKKSNPDLCLAVIGDSHVRHYSAGIQALAGRLGITTPIFWVNDALNRQKLRSDRRFTPSTNALTVGIPAGFLKCKKRLIVWSVMSGFHSLTRKATLFINQTRDVLERFSKLACTVHIGDTPSFSMLANDVEGQQSGCLCLKGLGRKDTGATCSAHKEQVLGKFEGKTFPRYQAETFKNHSNVSVILMEDQVCDGPICPVTYNGIPVYADSDHFSVSFAYLFAPAFAEIITAKGCPKQLYEELYSRPSAPPQH